MCLIMSITNSFFNNTPMDSNIVSTQIEISSCDLLAPFAKEYISKIGIVIQIASIPLRQKVVASMGVIGIVAYAYFYFVRGKIMFNNLKRFNITLSLGIIAFEIQSLMDAGSFIPFPYLLIIIVLTAMIEHNNGFENKTFMKTINI